MSEDLRLVMARGDNALGKYRRLYDPLLGSVDFQSAVDALICGRPSAILPLF